MEASILPIKRYRYLIALLLVSFVFLLPNSAHAAAVSYGIVVGYKDEGCQLTLNGNAESDSIRVKPGDDVQVNVTSQTSNPHAVSYASVANPTASLGSGNSKTFTNIQENMIVTVELTGGSACWSGQKKSAYIIVSSSGGSSNGNQTTTTTTGEKNNPDMAAQEGTTTSTTGDTKPALSTVTVDGKVVDATKPFTVRKSESIVLSGTAAPNADVTLTIHSTPKTVTAKANESGMWMYTIAGLEPGDHYVEASVKDVKTGKLSAATKLVSFKVSDGKTSSAKSDKKPASHTDSKDSGGGKGLLVGLLIVVAVIVAGAAFAVTPQGKRIVRSLKAKLSGHTRRRR